MPPIGQLTSNRLLESFFFNYEYPGFIADQIINIVDVPSRFFRVNTFNDAPMRIPDGRTAPRGRVNSVEIPISQQAFEVEDIYLENPVDRIEGQEAGSSSIPLLRLATEDIAYKIRLIHEKDVADIITNTANYAASNRTTLAGAQQWTDPASTPVNDIWAGIEAMLSYPDKIVFGPSSFRTFMTHQQVRDIFGISGGAGGRVGRGITREDIAGYFGVQTVVVGYERYDPNPEGITTAAPIFIWPDSVAILHNPAGVGTGGGAMAHSLAFSNVRSFGAQYFDHHIGPRGSDIVRAGWDRKYIVKSNKHGYLISDTNA